MSNDKKVVQLHPVQGRQKRPRPACGVDKAVELTRIYIAEKGYTYNLKAHVFLDKYGSALTAQELKSYLHEFCVRNHWVLIHAVPENALNVILKEEQEAAYQQFRTFVRTTSSKNDDSALRQILKIYLDPSIEVEHFEFAVQAFRHWMWLVKRHVMNKPVEWEIMLVLYSKGQGTGKSTFARKLMAPFHAASMDANIRALEVGASQASLCRQFIVFFDELAGLRQVSIETVKNAITRKEVSERILYTHTTETTPSRVTYIGASNSKLATTIHDTDMRRFAEIPWRQSRLSDEEITQLNSIDILNVWNCVDGNEAIPIYKQHEALFKQYQDKLKAREPIALFVEEYLIPVKGPIPDSSRPTLMEIHEEYVQHCIRHRSRNKEPNGFLIALNELGVVFAAENKRSEVCQTHVLIHKGEK